MLAWDLENKLGQIITALKLDIDHPFVNEAELLIDDLKSAEAKVVAAKTMLEKKGYTVIAPGASSWPAIPPESLKSPGASSYVAKDTPAVSNAPDILVPMNAVPIPGITVSEVKHEAL